MLICSRFTKNIQREFFRITKKYYFVLEVNSLNCTSKVSSKSPVHFRDLLIKILANELPLNINITKTWPYLAIHMSEEKDGWIKNVWKYPATGGTFDIWWNYWEWGKGFLKGNILYRLLLELSLFFPLRNCYLKPFPILLKVTNSK